jgi:imidazolonepropionase
MAKPSFKSKAKSRPKPKAKTKRAPGAKEKVLLIAPKAATSSRRARSSDLAELRRPHPEKKPMRVFRNISKLYSLAPVAAKGARHVLESDLGVVEKAAMVEHDGVILWVGEEKFLPKNLDLDLQSIRHVRVEDVDLGGTVVIPAFVESHTHLVYAGSRADEFDRRNRGESYQSIAKSGGGILSTVRATRAASESQLEKKAGERAARFVRQGVTTIEVKSGYGLDQKTEFKMLRAAGKIKGPRVVRTFLGAHAHPPESVSVADYLSVLQSEVLPLVRKERLAERVDIFVEAGYFSSDIAKTYLAVAKGLGFDVVVHADQLTRSGGSRLALEVGARSADHLLKINDDEIKALATSEVTCVLLPVADLYVNCPYPPARGLIDAGARVALATDYNPGTAPSQDLSLVGVLARMMMKMTLPEVLAAYTIGAAYALGLESRLGSLEAGKLCDFCVLEDGIEGLFYEVGYSPVTKVVREGIFLHGE